MKDCKILKAYFIGAAIEPTEQRYDNDKKVIYTYDHRGGFVVDVRHLNYIIIHHGDDKPIAVRSQLDAVKELDKLDWRVKDAR